MAVSWIVSFVSQYAIMRLALRNSETWDKHAGSGRSLVYSAYGLGAYPGVIVFLVLGLIIPGTDGPVIYRSDLFLICVWIILLIVIGAAGGHIAIRKHQTTLAAQ
jgi:prolipoprotein diacylglyceryltransferase